MDLCLCGEYEHTYRGGGDMSIPRVGEYEHMCSYSPHHIAGALRPYIFP